MRRYAINQVGGFDFVASVTKVNGSQIDRIVGALDEHGLATYGFRKLMFCPLTADPSTHKAIKRLHHEHDIHVSCDSGGYESQINDQYTLQDIYHNDRRFYTENDWPDELVLPDVVPLTGDSEREVEHKVQDTISLSRLLYRDLPEEKQRKAVPVVQGHTKQQIIDCIDAYKELSNIQKIGFGSFSTAGVNGGVNLLNEDNIELLQYAVKEAQKHDLEVHAFGVGGPTSIPILYHCGVDSFDSTSWIRTAGYGNVLFPFKSRLNISHRRDRSGDTMFRENFREMKDETDHECPFCKSFEKLQKSRDHRVIHNLIVMREMVDRVQNYDINEVLEMMNSASKYTTYLRGLATS